LSSLPPLPTGNSVSSEPAHILVVQPITAAWFLDQLMEWDTRVERLVIDPKRVLASDNGRNFPTSACDSRATQFRATLFRTEAKKADESLQAQMSVGCFLEGTSMARGLSKFLNALPSLEVCFCTSGTEGESKIIMKKGAFLLREAQTLVQVYRMQPGTSIHSWVLPFHIYGFLNTVLVPLLLKGGCYISSPWETPSSQSFMVITPALWRSFFHELKNLPIDRWPCGFLTSTAPFLFDEDVASLVKCKSIVGWEVLGSTETGGLLFRQLNGECDGFNLLPGVNFQALEDSAIVFSPWLDFSGMALNDIFVQTTEGKWKHSGRNDEVFKWCGKRYSLTEIELKLQKHFNLEVICAYLPSSCPKGGDLVAFLCPIEDAAERFKSFRQLFPDLPSIVKWKFVASIPRDHLGKLRRKDLSILGDDPGTPADLAIPADPAIPRNHESQGNASTEIK
jgi:hypothetical protein